MCEIEDAYLFEKLLLDGDVVVGYAEHDQSVFWLLERTILLGLQRDEIELIYEFVLNQDERLHRVLKSKFMLAHLAEDGADV